MEGRGDLLMVYIVPLWGLLHTEDAENRQNRSVGREKCSTVGEEAGMRGRRDDRKRNKGRI